VPVTNSGELWRSFFGTIDHRIAATRLSCRQKPRFY